jgi:hypothetical protein
MRHNQLHKPQIAAAGVSARGTSTSKAQQTASSGSDGMNNHSAAEEAEQREVLASLLKWPKGGRRRTDQSIRHVILYAGNEARAQWEKSTSIPNKRSADRPMYLLTYCILLLAHQPAKGGGHKGPELFVRDSTAESFL